MRRVVIISENCEGPDYFECVCDVPEEMDLKAERDAWNEWYRQEYCADWSSPKKVQYHSLLDRLLANGCKVIEMEEFSV